MSARSCFALTILMFLVSTACTGRRAGPASASALSRHTVLDVENQTWGDLTIYLVREGGGGLIRVGRVESLKRRRFEVMSGSLNGASVQLQARRTTGHANRSRGFIEPSTFLGTVRGQGGIYITHPFDALHGTPLHWVIAPEMRLSSVSMP